MDILVRNEETMEQAGLLNRMFDKSSGEESRGSSSPDERSVRPRRSRSEARWSGKQGERRWSSVSRLSGKEEKDRRDKIERENQILLRKILDCHHGHDRDRTSGIPSSGRRSNARGLEGEQSPRKGVKEGQLTKQNNSRKTSNQINQKRRKQKTDYENLLLLQKIQSAKPSSWVKKSFP
eukprot:GFUD01130622.1.p1 GENE.GFUD01130622.1~~GFUD01130622.1.p1  ORF type:complete len:179 (+),score=49.53 GFUD01130622.1:34-570(+)